MRQIFACVLTLIAISCSSAYAINVPAAYSKRSNRFITYSIKAGRKAQHCEAAFDSKAQETRAVIKAANLEFVRRGWSSEFLEERFRIAEEFGDRSHYIYARSKDSKNFGQIVGTIGVTFAEFGPGLSEQALPEESSLGIRLERPGKSGFIAELRAWSMRHDLPVEVRNHLYSMLINGVTKPIFEKLKGTPDLYTQPILHLYADELSLRFYGAMGFKQTHEKPIEHEGTRWWDMAITPQRLERFAERFKDLESFGNFNYEKELEVYKGLKIFIKPGGSFTKQLRSDGTYVVATGYDQERADYPFPKTVPDSVVMWKDGQLQQFEPAFDTRLKEGYLAQAGGAVIYEDDWSLYRFQSATDQVIQGFRVKAGRGVTFYMDGSLQSFATAVAFSDADGKHYAVGDLIYLAEGGNKKILWARRP